VKKLKGCLTLTVRSKCYGGFRVEQIDGRTVFVAILFAKIAQLYFVG
jgi:hypothetical protein